MDLSRRYPRLASVSSCLDGKLTASMVRQTLTFPFCPISEILFVCCITTEKYVKIVPLIQLFISAWNNRCIHSDDLASRNAAVGPYKTKPLNKGDNTVVIIYICNFILFSLYICTIAPMVKYRGLFRYIIIKGLCSNNKRTVFPQLFLSTMYLKPSHTPDGLLSSAQLETFSITRICGSSR